MAVGDRAGAGDTLQAAELTIEPRHHGRPSRPSRPRGGGGSQSLTSGISVACWAKMNAGSISFSFTSGRSASLKIPLLGLDRFARLRENRYTPRDFCIVTMVAADPSVIAEYNRQSTGVRCSISKRRFAGCPTNWLLRRDDQRIRLIETPMASATPAHA